MRPNVTTDRVIAAWLQDGPTGLSAAERSAIADAAEVLAQRRSRFSIWLPGPRRAFAFTATVVVVVVASALLPSLRELPMFGGPSPTSIVTPAASSSATPAPSGCLSEIPTRQVQWSGRVRTDLAGMPVICITAARTDPTDASEEGVDIVGIDDFYTDQPQWSFSLAGFPPAAASLHPAETVIEYGLVFETTGDGVADYVVGINNDAPKAGDFRVWVTRLATGVREQQVGAPYGYPVEFSHPDERAADPEHASPTMTFTFLSGSAPWAWYGGQGDLPGEDVRFYVWASVTSGSDVIAWDYAPDYGWLTSRDQPPGP